MGTGSGSRPSASDPHSRPTGDGHLATRPSGMQPLSVTLLISVLCESGSRLEGEVLCFSGVEASRWPHQHGLSMYVHHAAKERSLQLSNFTFFFFVQCFSR